MYKILIVDDEELERIVLRKHLEESQLPIMVVGETSNGKETLSDFAKYHPDIVLMDIKMPGMDGLEVTKNLKKINKDVEIIFITAHSLFSYSSSAIRLRAADYLVKPVRPIDLYKSIERVIVFLKEKKAKMVSAKHIEATFPEPSFEKNENIVINKLKKYIQKNFQERLTLDILATTINYNPSYISNLFKKTTGKSITEYITKIRIDESKKLLVNTQKSIDEIADCVGLNNNSYFTAIFKKIEGINPSDYRRMCSS